MGRLVEGVWDCPYCGTDRIRGLLHKCPHCGRQRDNTIKFYLADPKNYVDEQTEKTINRNPDWLCPFCDGLNSDDNDVCYNCGASREESTENYFTNKEKREAEEKRKQEKPENKEMYDDTYDEQPDEEISNQDLTSHETNSSSFFEEKVQKSKNNSKWSKLKKPFLFSGLVLAILTVLLGITALCIPKVQTVEVQSFSWERVLEIEEYRTVEESDWSVPSGGRLIRQQQEIQSYRQVLDHYETKTRQVAEQVLDHYETVVVGHRDLGNGMFEEITQQQPVYRTEYRTETYQEPVYRNEPVYATKYYYEIERWLHKSDERTSGNDKNPVWSDYKIKENEREGSKTETYKVSVVTEKGEEKEFTMKFDEWNSLNTGQTVKLKTYINGKAEILLE